MIDNKGHLTIIDWGMAKQKYQFCDQGQVLGTPAYLDPVCVQQVEGLDTRSDIYSMGASAYHMLTGELPYFHEDVETMIDMAINEPTPMANQINPDVSEGTAQLIYYMMSKKYETRYGCWRDVQAGIREVSSKLGPE